jgi:hypothetical protein
MSAFFQSPPIDLVEHGKRQSRPASSRRFAAHVVSMADQTVHRYMSTGELRGVLSCVQQQLRSLKWRDYIFGIPVNSHRYIDGTFELEGRDQILPEAVVATTLRYREALNEQGTGLRSIIFGEFVCGLEWACYSSIFESSLEPKPQVPLIEPSAVNQYVREVA